MKTALQGRPRPWSLAIVLGAIAFFALLRPSAADMSKEWAALLEQAAQKLRDNDTYGLGEVLKSMAAEDSARSVTTITKIIDKAGGDPGLIEAVRDGFSKQSSKDALKAQLKSCSGAKSARLRVLLVQLANGRGGTQDMEAVIKAVADSDPVVATNAIRAICAKRLEAGIDPMIARMEKLDKSMDPPWAELKFSLGEALRSEALRGADYRSWWESLKSRGGLSAVSEDERAEFEKERERPTTGGGGGRMSSAVRLFGTEIECTRIVFILDISGSMLTIDPGDGDSDPGPVSSAPRGDPSEDKPKEDPNTRMARARRELIRVIKALPASTQVNIIAYSSTVSLWKPDGLVKLDAKAKTDAVAFIEKMVAQGVTATDEALRSGLKVKGARCLYLLSDGKPSMGPGADIDPSTIYTLVDEENKTTQMRIFTLGFRGADQSFMRELAKRTGGTYADIR